MTEDQISHDLLFADLQTREQFVRYLEQLRRDMIEKEMKNHTLRNYVTHIAGAIDIADPDPEKRMDFIQESYGVFEELGWRHLGRIFSTAGAID